MEATIGIASLLPEDPSGVQAQIYQVGPWWSMVHNSMQALTVCLLKLAYQVLPVIDYHEEIMAFEKDDTLV